MEIPDLASTALRCGASDCMSAAIATAYLGDLIWGGILPPEANYLTVDAAKVHRARDKIMEAATERREEKTNNKDIKCLMFYLRIDKKTKVRYYDEETHKLFNRI